MSGLSDLILSGWEPREVSKLQMKGRQDIGDDYPARAGEARIETCNAHSTTDGLDAPTGRARRGLKLV